MNVKSRLSEVTTIAVLSTLTVIVGYVIYIFSGSISLAAVQTA